MKFVFTNVLASFILVIILNAFLTFTPFILLRTYIFVDGSFSALQLPLHLPRLAKLDRIQINKSRSNHTWFII